MYNQPRKPHPDVTQARIAVDGLAALVQTLTEENQQLKVAAARSRGNRTEVVRTRFHGSPQLEQPNHRSAVDHGHTGAWQLYLDSNCPPGASDAEGYSEAESIAWCLYGTIPVRP